MLNLWLINLCEKLVLEGWSGESNFDFVCNLSGSQWRGIKSTSDNFTLILSGQQCVLNDIILKTHNYSARGLGEK